MKYQQNLAPPQKKCVQTYKPTYLEVYNKRTKELCKLISLVICIKFYTSLLKKVYYKCMNIRYLHLYKKCSFYPLQPEVDMTRIPVIISDIPLLGNYVTK